MSDGGKPTREDRLIGAFDSVFGDGDALVTRAPGRVNLIGEHTDYNDGFVLPAAIDRYILIASAPSRDGLFHLHSLDHGDTVTRSLEPPYSTGHWSDYVVAVAAVLRDEGHAVPAVTAVVEGDVPQGSGLSSSAALEVCTALALCRHGGLTLEGPDLARVCQQGENRFVGVQCGIMDPFASALAGEGCVLFLDCRDLSYEQVPFRTEDLVLAVTDSGVPRRLSEGAYNERRRECEAGVEAIDRLVGGVGSLRDVSPEILGSVEGDLPSTIAKRCRHIVEENARVLEAVDCLRAGDFEGFGVLMGRSHESLRRLYEVSCRELDILVEIASSHRGVLGSRMTGAGFGGCTVSLVETGAYDDFAGTVRERYRSATGITPTIHRLRPSSGALALL